MKWFVRSSIVLSGILAVIGWSIFSVHAIPDPGARFVASFLFGAAAGTIAYYGWALTNNR